MGKISKSDEVKRDLLAGLLFVITLALIKLLLLFAHSFLFAQMRHPGIFSGARMCHKTKIVLLGEGRAI